MWATTVEGDLECLDICGWTEVEHGRFQIQIGAMRPQLLVPKTTSSTKELPELDITKDCRSMGVFRHVRS